MALEANAWTGFKRSGNFYIYQFFYVVNQLLLTKSYLKLTCAWIRKVLTCYVSVIKRFPKHEKRRVNLHSQFAEQESL